MPTDPATVLVKAIVATPLALVVTVPLPTNVPVPLAMEKVTEALGTGLPNASTMVALTLLVAVPFAIAPVVTTVRFVPAEPVLGAPATNSTVAGLPVVIEAPPTVAVMPTEPATVLVREIVAIPLEFVVTVLDPTKVPLPLEIVNVTVAFGTALPNESTIAASTVLVAVPLATAPVVTTERLLREASGLPGTNMTRAGVPKMIDWPLTFAVIEAVPAIVLVKVMIASPFTSVNAPMPPVAPFIVKTTCWLTTGLPLESTIWASTVLVATPLATASLTSIMSLVLGLLRSGILKKSFLGPPIPAGAA